jgi:outer membrane protein assembly factor BamB
MSDTRQLLENEQAREHPAPGAFDRFERLRHRRERNGRLATGGAALLAVFVLGAVFYSLGGMVVHRNGALDASSVPTLRMAWSARVGPDPSWSYSVLSGGVLYVASEDGHVYAFDASCRPHDAVCPPLWVGTLGAPANSAPVVSGGMVYVTAGLSDTGGVGGPGAVVAFPITCPDEGSGCRPAWIRHLGPGSAPAGPTVADGRVFVLVQSGAGALYAFDERTGAVVWKASTPKGLVAYPVVAGGRVYSAPWGGPLYEFEGTCGTSNRVCGPVSSRSLPWVGEDAPALGTDGTNVFVNAGARLLALSASCPRGLSCAPLWTAQPPDGTAFSTSPSVWGGELFIGTQGGELLAYPASCVPGDKVCAPVWTGRTGGPVEVAPAIGNGIVLASTERASVIAFDTRCANPCTALWKARTDGILSSPASVSRDAVIVATNAGKLYAFTVRGSARVASSDRALAIAVYAALALLAALEWRRRRRVGVGLR